MNNKELKDVIRKHKSRSGFFVLFTLAIAIGFIIYSLLHMSLIHFIVALLILIWNTLIGIEVSNRMALVVLVNNQIEK